MNKQFYVGMKIKLGIINYNVGNIFSIIQACHQAGIQTQYVSTPDEFDNVDGLILPGVGAFGAAMEKLRKREMIDPLISYVDQGKYLIGICLGMQLLLSRSFEFGIYDGLGLIDGTVKKFQVKNKSNTIDYSVPQIQWNQIKFFGNEIEPPLNFFNNTDYMYFVHSFYCDVDNKENIIATTNYAGIEYPSIIRKKNIIGMQFHPEKSAVKGLNFYNELKKCIK